MNTTDERYNKVVLCVYSAVTHALNDTQEAWLCHETENMTIRVGADGKAQWDDNQFHFTGDLVLRHAIDPILATVDFETHKRRYQINGKLGWHPQLRVSIKTRKFEEDECGSAANVMVSIVGGMDNYLRSVA